MEKKSIHEGHRGRLMNTVFEIGLDNLSDIQVVEFMLFYIFPRSDVNPLAHRLIDKFGNLSNIIDANVNDLKTVDGIGDRAAKAIICLGRLFDKVSDYRAQRNVQLVDRNAIADYFEELMRFQSSERLYLVAVDHSCRVVNKYMVAKGSVKNVAINPTEIANFILSTKAAGIIIAHNHPSGRCKPSQADISATDKIVPLIENLGTAYLEHIIVGDDGVYAMKADEMIRVYDKDFI